MRVYTEVIYKWDAEGDLQLVSEKSFEHEGPVALCLRGAAAAAGKAADEASQTGEQLGTEAQQSEAELQPFFSREMQAEHLYDPSQINELLTSAGAGIGGAAGSADEQMKREAELTGNPNAVSAGQQQLARDKMKTAAGVGEGVASQDVMGAKQLNQEGAAGMSGLHGTDLKGQLEAMGQIAPDINAEVNANKTGWLQNAEGVIGTLGQAAGGAGEFMEGLSKLR